MNDDPPDDAGDGEPGEGEPGDGEMDGVVDAEVDPFITWLQTQGLMDDDLAIAEVSATGGPTYELASLPTPALRELLDQLEDAGVQHVVDHDGQLVVHHNDEARAEAVLDRLFGVEESPEPAPAPADPHFTSGNPRVTLTVLLLIIALSTVVGVLIFAT